MRYGYSNARVYGMIGLLLSKTDMEELIRVKTIAGMFELLQRTGYKDDLAGLSASKSSAVEIGSVKHFGRITRKIISFTPKDDIPVVNAFIERWVFLDLKLIINAKKLRIPFDELRNHLFDLPNLRLSDAQQLYDLSIDILGDTIEHSYFSVKCCKQNSGADRKKIINDVIKDIKDPYERIKLKIDLNMFNFISKPIFNSSKELKKIKHSLQKEIDVRNILLILRIKKHSVSAQKVLKLLYPMGNISNSTLKNYVNLSYGDLINVIKVLYKNVKIHEDLSLPKIESLIEKYISHERAVMFHSSIFSVGPILQFLLLKEQEMNNLQKIAKAKMLGISEGELMDNLIVVR